MVQQNNVGTILAKRLCFELFVLSNNDVPKFTSQPTLKIAN